MRGATLFSGIGVPELAAPEINWLWCAEIAPFPAAVHAARFPNTPNLGDVEKIDVESVERPDVIVFGSPCQDFSVAGKRLGLDGPRGNLALVALGIIDRLRPEWFVFENVPGLLSSWSGAENGSPEANAEWETTENSDFAAFLGAVDEIGYSGAWASLDAQFFDLAQRRERVFFVGHIADWRRAAAVLLEPESLCGDTPPRRSQGQGFARDVAPSLTGSGRGVARPGETRGQDPVIAIPILEAGASTGASTTDPRAGIGIGEPGDPMFTLQSGKQHAIGFSCKDHGADAVSGIDPTLRAMGHGGSHANAGGQVAVAFDQRGRDGGAQFEGPHDTANIRAASGGSSRSFVAFQSKASSSQSMNPSDISPSLDVGKSDGVAIAFGHNDTSGPVDVSHALNAHAVPHGRLDFESETFITHALRGEGFDASEDGTGRGTPLPAACGGVRRLTPVECEKLQGLPDDFTNITYRGKPAADGPRYKAIGNAMPRPVLAWILSRIKLLHEGDLPNVRPSQ